MKFYPFKVIEEEDGWKILEKFTINDRTLLCWHSPNTETTSLSLFHLTDQPNDLSKRSNITQWGYTTHHIPQFQSLPEAAEVVSLFLQDMEKENFWWEIDKLH